MTWTTCLVLFYHMVSSSSAKKSGLYCKKFIFIRAAEAVELTDHKTDWPSLPSSGVQQNSPKQLFARLFVFLSVVVHTKAFQTSPLVFVRSKKIVMFKKHWHVTAHYCGAASSLRAVLLLTANKPQLTGELKEKLPNTWKINPQKTHFIMKWKYKMLLALGEKCKCMFLWCKQHRGRHHYKLFVWCPTLITLPASLESCVKASTPFSP